MLPCVWSRAAAPEAPRRPAKGFGANTPGRNKIKPADWICFYANGKGVVAHAKGASPPDNKPHKAVHNTDRYAWVYRVTSPKLYLDGPVLIDSEHRSHLDAFKERDPAKPSSDEGFARRLAAAPEEDVDGATVARILTAEAEPGENISHGELKQRLGL